MATASYSRCFVRMPAWRDAQQIRRSKKRRADARANPFVAGHRFVLYGRYGNRTSGHKCICQPGLIPLALITSKAAGLIRYVTNALAASGFLLLAATPTA